MEQRPAEREPLRHSARVRRHALVARLPQREPLEEHADPLAPLRHAVEPAVEIEVLERGELPVDERLVREVADAASDRRPTTSSPRVGSARPARRRSSVVFPLPFGPVTTAKPAARDGDVHAAQHALAAVPLLDVASADHATSTSSATKTKNTTLITPFIVKNAASSRRRSPGRTIECS